MKELVFQVKFLSDIVLPATSNTEGNIEQLDFIPGSNFLGMVAREYSTFDDSFLVFHSGKVRFGDATPVVEDNASYKMPLSFFYEKLDESKIVNHHLIENFPKDIQLKQKRNGYITSDLEVFSIQHHYAQKSAYNKDERRSKEGAMYGYQSIPADTLWQFVVKCDNDISSQDLQKIETILTGKKRLGKSKSSQYGRVYISKASKLATVNCLDSKETVVLYAKSRLALVDEEGMPTFNLKYLTDGLNDENIVWEKCQIKTSLYTPYNGAMQTKSYERAVINAGSVIVLQNLSQTQLDSLKNGIGVYLSEGFGEVLVNPAFLEKEGVFSFKEIRDENSSDGKVTLDTDLARFLEKRKDKISKDIDIAKKVQVFKKKHTKLYEKIKNAQWGTIRSICSNPNSDFRNEIRDYISSGKVTWSTEQIETLLEKSNSRVFIKLLSMQMPKVKKEQQDEN